MALNKNRVRTAKEAAENLVVLVSSVIKCQYGTHHVDVELLQDLLIDFLIKCSREQKKLAPGGNNKKGN